MKLSMTYYQLLVTIDKALEINPDNERIKNNKVLIDKVLNQN